MNYMLLGLFFVVIIGMSALFNFLILKWTRTLGRKNDVNTNEPRWSADYKPAVGGITLYIVLLVSLLAYYFQDSSESVSEDMLMQFGIIACITIGFFAGLVDDAFNTVPWLKFAAQFSCGLVLVLFGVNIEFFEVFYLDAFLTIFWTVAVMNSINMLDNMDGISASVSVGILLCAGICALPLQEETFFFTMICSGISAGLIGFLFFNWNPSKMFMGDTGSQLLGALLAAVGIVFFWNNEHIVTGHHWYSKIAIVLTAFAIPIGDSMTVTINRLRRGQSPFVGGRDHTTHHLSYAGLSDSQVAIVMVLISLLSIGLISGLFFISESILSIYLSVMALYAIIIITFLYSTTMWKKSRVTFKSKEIQQIQ